METLRSSWEGLPNAASQFVIDTKFPGGFGDGPSTREEVIQVNKVSLQKLNTDHVIMSLAPSSLYNPHENRKRLGQH